MTEATTGNTEGKVLREQLVALLDGGKAHMTFDLVIADMPLDAANTMPENFNYTPWQLLEHARRAQVDVLKFVKDPAYKSPPYEEFWPDPDYKVSEEKWRETVAAFRVDLDEAIALARNQATDFFSPIPHAPDYNIFREILLIADHNAYHFGEFMAMRKILNVLPPENW